MGASLAAAATQIIRIRFTAFNDGPVNPVVGSFEFEVKGPSGVLAGRFSPTVVTVNYGTFTPQNVVGFFDVDPGLRLLGGVAPTVGGPGNVPPDVSILVPGTDTFELFHSLSGERGSQLGYTVSGTDGSWRTSGHSDDSDSKLTVEVEIVPPTS